MSSVTQQVRRKPDVKVQSSLIYGCSCENGSSWKQALMLPLPETKLHHTQKDPQSFPEWWWEGNPNARSDRRAPWTEESRCEKPRRRSRGRPFPGRQRRCDCRAGRRERSRGEEGNWDEAGQDFVEAGKILEMNLRGNESPWQLWAVGWCDWTWMPILGLLSEAWLQRSRACRERGAGVWGSPGGPAGWGLLSRTELWALSALTSQPKPFHRWDPAGRD